MKLLTDKRYEHLIKDWKKGELALTFFKF
jgi:hypothetical protein